MTLSGGSPRRHRNPFRLAATAVLGLVAAACASDSPVQPEHELFANRSAASCTNVQGVLVGNVFGASAVAGDLDGQGRRCPCRQVGSACASSARVEAAGGLLPAGAPAASGPRSAGPSCRGTRNRASTAAQPRCNSLARYGMVQP